MNFFGPLLFGWILVTSSIWSAKASDCHYYGAYFDSTLDQEFGLEDVAACEKACQDLKKCRYWTFDTLTHNCNLKHAYNGEPLLRPHLDMISGPRNCYGYDNKKDKKDSNKKTSISKNYRRNKNIIY